jgi:ADP-heptose:LPS heptosyltransferase
MSDRRKQRAALLFPGALGDFVCLLPALATLARETRVVVFAKSEFADIAPSGISVATLEYSEISRLFVAGGGSEKRVRDFFSPYAFIYSWMGSREPVFAAELRAAASGEVRLFGFRGADAALQQSDYYLSCLGLRSDDLADPIIPLQRRAVTWCRQVCAQHTLEKRPTVVIAPGSGAREKNWPAAYFSAVAAWWRERTQGDVIALMGPAEEERGGYESLTDHCITVRDLDLAQVVALLSRAALFLGNDSGVTHLAALLGVPTVSIFGPSDPRVWQPVGARSLVLRLGVDCSPCARETMIHCPHRKCLTEFLPERIISALERFIETINLDMVQSRD